MSLKKKSMLQILLLGDDKVGKSSLVYRYLNEECSRNLKATKLADVFTKELIRNDSLVSLQIWDTNDEFKSMGTAFYKVTHGCIFVFDVTRRKSFESIKSWWNEFCVMTNKKNANNFPVAVVGNKIDLEKDRKVSKQEAQDWCKSLSIPYFECSSKDNINVEQVFKAMTAKLVDINKL